MIYITSDLHLGHDKPFVWQARGFECIEAHDREIVRRWNERISDDDTVYLLGDVMMNDTDRGMEHLRSLHGEIHIVIGNHDTPRKTGLYTQSPNVAEVAAALYLKQGKQMYYMSHYPTLTDNTADPSQDKQVIVNLYGHTHQKDNFFIYEGHMVPFMYHVGVDSHGLGPVSLDEIKIDMAAAWEMLRSR
ncbi:MAG: metallophosphoesterase family protein [Oscillospiraceae bacterium]|nr:metallophosphoesterase family protein [Oscillospiraceae bacterium]MBQ8979294.1 metallophosphoesterase family protein [Oscillospiraceae bacterium]